VPLLQEETARALSEEVDRLNRQPRVPRWMSRLAGQPAPDLRNPAGEWHIEFVADPDGELHEGDLLVDSQLVLPGRPELGVGERTRRITTILRGPQTITKAQTTPAPSGSAKPPVLAQISYEDAAGPHIYDIVRDSLSIGRGGITFPVDLRVECSADVSREHARLRRDTATGRFFLIDLSSLGTTLNGRHVPRGYDEVDGRKRENGAETALPEQARIGLADTVFLDFRQVR
jgi:pSer/pThr/pTyr-binding forkhead associated (FHA) protein